MKKLIQKSGRGRIVAIALIISIFVIAESCAAHGKYKKHKAIPCPCETERRR